MRALENKLIIEFLGHKVDRLGFTILPRGKFNTSTVQYDKDWSWLMDVVEKIEETVVELSCFEVTIGKHSVRISDGESYDETTDFGGNRLITTFTAVINFINWYNESK